MFACCLVISAVDIYRRGRKTFIFNELRDFMLCGGRLRNKQFGVILHFTLHHGKNIKYTSIMFSVMIVI